jgi:hypothetical protein
MEVEPPPVKVIGLGAPASVKLPLPDMVMEPLGLELVIVPLSTRVLLLASDSVMFLFEANVIPESMVTFPALMLALPPFRFSVPVPAAVFVRVTAWLPVLIATLPPVVEIVVAVLLGTLTMRSLVEIPALSVIADAPVALIGLPEGSGSDGVLTMRAPPPAMLCVVPDAKTTEPPAACELNLIEPEVPALKL